MDGVTLLRNIKEDPRLEEIAVVLISDLDDVSQEAEAIEAGADDYTVKPLEPERLIVRARRAMDVQAERRRLRHESPAAETP